jgi:hypothetical protein
MIATIHSQAGDILYVGVSTFNEDEFTDAEKTEFARLMHDIDRIVTAVSIRRELRRSKATLNLGPIEPFTADQLRRFGAKDDA